MALIPRLFSGSDGKVNVTVPRDFVGGINLRLVACSTSICFYSSFMAVDVVVSINHGVWACFIFTPIRDELHSVLLTPSPVLMMGTWMASAGR